VGSGAAGTPRTQNETAAPWGAAVFQASERA
jgi:hypothetical protein